MTVKTPYDPYSKRNIEERAKPVLISTYRFALHAPVSPVSDKLKDLGIQVDLDFDATNFRDEGNAAQKTWVNEELTTAAMKLKLSQMVQDDQRNHRKPSRSNPDITLSFEDKSGSQIVDVYVRHRDLPIGKVTELFAYMLFAGETKDGTHRARTFQKEIYCRDTNATTAQLLDTFLYTAGVVYEVFVADSLDRLS